MCPVCIGSALLVLTGTGSAGGLTLVAARVLGARAAKTPAPLPRPHPPAQLRIEADHRRI
jgi:hypothetical protein